MSDEFTYTDKQRGITIIIGNEAGGGRWYADGEPARGHAFYLKGDGSKGSQFTIESRNTKDAFLGNVRAALVDAYAARNAASTRGDAPETKKRVFLDIGPTGIDWDAVADQTGTPVMIYMPEPEEDEVKEEGGTNVLGAPAEEETP